MLANSFTLKVTKEARVGIFAVVAISLLYFGFNFLRGRKFFSSYQTYYVSYNNAEGLVNATAVTLNGVKVGHVEDIRIPDYAKPDSILVTLFINPQLKITYGSIATVTKPGLLDGNIISLKLDSGSTQLEEHGFLKGFRELDLTTTINSMVSPIKDKSEQVLVTLEKVLGSLRQVFNEQGTQNLTNSVLDFSGAIHALRLTSENLKTIVEQEGGNIHRTLSNMENITGAVAKNSTQISETIKNLQSVSDSLANSRLKSAVNNLDKLLAELNTMTEKINKGQGSMGLLVNDKALYENLVNSNKELQALLKDMQRYPGRYIHVSVFGGSAKKADAKREKDLKSGSYKP